MPEEMRPLWGLRDPASTVTHAVTCLWALYATAFLWRLCRGQPRKQWALACFGASMTFLYAASATYHALQLPPDQLRFYQLLDHSAIYGLIAGSYTPAFAVLIASRWRRRLLLGGIWSLAAAGITCKWLFTGVPYWVTVSLYLGMGWVGMLVFLELYRIVGLRGALWTLGGGLFYSAGAVADWMQWPVPYAGYFGYHEVFHVCDMAGTFCHFMFMVQCVVPYQAAPSDDEPEPEFGILEKAAMEESA
jgi:hemolysin III